jgi:hypothetical protein
MFTRKTVRNLAICLLAYHVALLMPFVAMAQDQPQQGQVPATPNIVRKVGEGNQYYLGQANELLIRVNVWGKVNRPGQYYVPAATDLITLLSAAGGPIPRSRLSDVRIIRTSPGSENEVIIVDVKKFMRTGDKRLIPELKPEDTVVVHGSTWQFIGDLTQLVGGMASVAVLYFYLFVAKR